MFRHIRRDDNRRCEKPTAPHYASDGGLRIDDGVGPFHDKRQAPFWLISVLSCSASPPTLNWGPCAIAAPNCADRADALDLEKCNTGQASLQAEMSAQVAFSFMTTDRTVWTAR